MLANRSGIRDAKSDTRHSSQGSGQEGVNFQPSIGGQDSPVADTMWISRLLVLPDDRAGGPRGVRRWRC